MAEVIPFRALRYDPHRIPDLAQVVTPPYDVISPEAQDRYYARHPNNVIRLVLAKHETQGAAGSRYAQAAATYATWRREGILRRDATPAFYLYEQEFSAGQPSRLRRRGLLALVRLHEYAEQVILPHERTFSRHKDDRLQLMRACPANLEAILGFYSGSNTAIRTILDRTMDTVPAVRVTDEDGVGHRLWLVEAPPAVAALCAALRNRPVVIADGHHRYETALTFRNERRGQHPPSAAAAAGRRLDEFVLMNLVSSDDPGLVILPTHRVIRRPPARRGAALAEALAGHFRIVPFPLDAANPLPSLQAALADLARREGAGIACGLFTGGGEILVMELTDPAVPRAFLAEGRATAYAELDVAVLHRLLVEDILGIPQATQTDDSIQYTRDASLALEAVRSGEAAAALFLNPPRVDQVQAIAMAGERMPQKSTFFYPKVLSGLVMSPLDEDG